MKTKVLPAIIMLVAGFIDCILSIYNHLSLWESTRQLLLVLIIFYLLGCAVQLVLDVNFKPMEENGEQGEAEEGSAEENTQEEQQEKEEEPLPENLEDIQSDT
jgi:phosphotransferase system  glucose/maltose/N-acetylglucosamine-specific IIC component